MLRYFSVVLLCCTGCGSPIQERLSTTASAPTERTEDDNLATAIFADCKSVTMLSHDGNWIGTDYDLTLKLNDDGSAIITDFGYAVTRTPATYTFDSQGCLVVTPQDGKPWPPMPVSLTDGILVVYPPPENVIRDAALAAGIPESEITQDAIKDSYDQWPLRQLPEDANNG
jgi:hypothetical protein